MMSGITIWGITKHSFGKLSEAKLTINLAKSGFCHATLTFLEHVVGQGQFKSMKAKVEAVSDFPVPTCKRQLMRSLGMPVIAENSVIIFLLLLNH